MVYHISVHFKLRFLFFSPFNVAAQNRSPAKNQNGRDNTESIDMEMSDEDFDTMPEFQSNFIIHSFLLYFESLDFIVVFI